VTDEKPKPIDLPPARVKRVLIAPEMLIHAFAQDERPIQVEKGIPLDSQFRGFAFDPARNCIVVFFEHPSFPEVTSGSEIQSLVIEARRLDK
jgi:hypothetical protein